MQHSASYTHAPVVSSVIDSTKKGAKQFYTAKKRTNGHIQPTLTSEMKVQISSQFPFSITACFYRFSWSCFQNSIAPVEKNMQHRKKEYAEKEEDNLSRRSMKPGRQPPFSISPMNISFVFESARGFSIFPFMGWFGISS